MRLISEYGFSLVELIVVIAILGILLSMVIPELNFNRLKINNNIYIVYSTFRRTRQTAIAECEDYFICLLPENRIGIRKGSEGSFNDIIEINQDFNLSCTRASNEIKFTPIGTAISGSFLISDGGYSKKVVVVGNGFIHIE